MRKFLNIAVACAAVMSIAAPAFAGSDDEANRQIAKRIDQFDAFIGDNFTSAQQTKLVGRLQSKFNACMTRANNDRAFAGFCELAAAAEYCIGGAKDDDPDVARMCKWLDTGSKSSVSDTETTPAAADFPQQAQPPYCQLYRCPGTPSTKFERTTRMVGLEISPAGATKACRDLQAIRVAVVIAGYSGQAALENYMSTTPGCGFFFGGTSLTIVDEVSEVGADRPAYMCLQPSGKSECYWDQVTIFTWKAAQAARR